MASTRRGVVMRAIRFLNIFLVWWSVAACGGADEPPTSAVEELDPSVDRPLPVGLVRLFGGVEMVRVPAGNFTMGMERGPVDQQPARQVYLSAFYIDRYEATNARYFRFWAAPDGGNRQLHTPASHGSRNGIGDWPERAETRPNFPVVGISWFDAAAYCAWRGARLPTEAEWEKTARGDEAREPYPWNKGLNGSRANYRDGDDGYDNTLAPVGNYPEGVSFYGAMDLVGNVWEWCADYYDSEYYKVSATIGPTGPEQGEYRVLRGGSWRTAAGQDPNKLSITYRSWSDPRGATDGWGVRCARDVN